MESTYCGTDQGPYKVAFYCNAVISCTKHGLTSRLLASLLGLGPLESRGPQRFEDPGYEVGKSGVGCLIRACCTMK